MKKFLGLLNIISFLMVSSPVQASVWHFDGNFKYDNDVVILDFYIPSAQTVTIFSSSWGTEGFPGNKFLKYGYVVDDGTGPVDGGGLDPMLNVWDADGNHLEYQDDWELSGRENTLTGNLTEAMADELVTKGKVVKISDLTIPDGYTLDWTYGWFDSYFEYTFDEAGWYSASIGQYNNRPNSDVLSDGFTWDGDANKQFTKTLGGAGPIGGGIVSTPEDYFNGVFDGLNPNTFDWVEQDPRTSYWAFHIKGIEVTEAFVRGTTIPEPATLLLLGIGLIGFAGVSRKRLNP